MICLPQSPMWVDRGRCETAITPLTASGGRISCLLELMLIKRPNIMSTLTAECRGTDDSKLPSQKLRTHELSSSGSAATTLRHIVRLVGAPMPLSANKLSTLVDC